MIPRHPYAGLDDRHVTYVLLGCLFATLVVIAVGVVFGGCSQPAVVLNHRSPSTCTTAPAFVSDTFCEESYAGTSPCVACFATIGLMPGNPIYGCVLPNNQYCVGEAGCGDQRCARVAMRYGAHDAGALLP